MSQPNNSGGLKPTSNSCSRRCPGPSSTPYAPTPFPPGSQPHRRGSDASSCSISPVSEYADPQPGMFRTVSRVDHVQTVFTQHQPIPHRPSHHGPSVLAVPDEYSLPSKISSPVPPVRSPAPSDYAQAYHGPPYWDPRYYAQHMASSLYQQQGPVQPPGKFYMKGNTYENIRFEGRSTGHLGNIGAVGGASNSFKGVTVTGEADVNTGDITSEDMRLIYHERRQNAEFRLMMMQKFGVQQDFGGNPNSHIQQDTPQEPRQPLNSQAESGESSGYGSQRGTSQRPVQTPSITKGFDQEPVD